MSNIEQTLKKQGDKLFASKEGILALWQEIAELMYPERADFTVQRNIGAELAAGLMTSFPILARRDLGNSFGSMLRPTAKEWFSIESRHQEHETTEVKQWFERVTKFMRKAMYDKGAKFRRATSEADHDFAAFGQAVISVELNNENNGMLYRCWHLRDVAWMEDCAGNVATIYRKWKPTVSELCELFEKTVCKEVSEKLAIDPFADVDCMHIIMPSKAYARLSGSPQVKQPFMSIYLDCEHYHIMEGIGSWTGHYAVPRWSTVSGSQFASSPATNSALPDARLIQEITRVVLDSGEMSVKPPMIAVQEAIRSDVSIFAGGITWVDAEYDEKMGEVLRPLTQDHRGLPFGMELIKDLREQISNAFFLNRLSLPPSDNPGDMTAYEVGQRVQEYIRHALPLFEPMDAEYNGKLCELTLEILLRNTPELLKEMPSSLSGAEYDFTFKSPLHDAINKLKVGQFMEAEQILAQGIQAEHAVRHIVDVKLAVRECLLAVSPAKWLRTEREADDLAKKDQQAMQAQQLLANMQQGANVAKTVKEASPTVGQGGYGGATL